MSTVHSPMLQTIKFFSLISVLLLAACNTPEPKAVCRDCGRVLAIEARHVPGDSSPAAAVAGAIIGGALGHQFGDGTGRSVATAFGALGGAIAGAELRRQQSQQTVFDFTVELDSGERIELTRAHRGSFKPGDKVILSGDELIPDRS